MARKFFAHSHVRTAIATFGKLFNSIYFAKYSSKTRKIDRLVRVPIRYLPQSLTRMAAEKEDDSFKAFFEYYPRMTFSFDGLAYDTSKQTSQFQLHRNKRNKEQYGFTPAPYTLSFTLHVIALDQTTAIQIVEQILPYFRPNLTVSVRNEVFDNQEHDILVNLDSITPDDSYEDIATKRIVHYTLNFSMDTNFYGDVAGADIELTKFIKDGGVVVDNDLPDQPDLPPDESGGLNPSAGSIIKKIIVDQIDFDRLDSTTPYWPVVERTEITADPSTAENHDEVSSYNISSYVPSDQDAQQKPPSK